MPRRCLTLLFLALGVFFSACAADDPQASRPQQPDGADEGTATRPLELTSPDDTPRLDRSMASVSLDEIVFDTFDGGSVPLSDADDELIARLFDVLEPIDAPGYERATEVDWLLENELVVGWVDPSGGAWAFPVRVLNFREIVNDELGGFPVVVTYCPLCGSGVVFDRRVDGTELSFSNSSALFENDMVMVDRETGSYWWQAAGTAIVGELTGAMLDIEASQTTTWRSWIEQFPDTLVMERPGGQGFDRDPFANYAARLDAGRTPFPVSDGVLDDDRLPPSARVVMVTVEGESRAWATAPARTVTDVVGGIEVTVQTDGTGAVVVDEAGELIPNRSLFWFSALTIAPELTLGP